MSSRPHEHRFRVEREAEATVWAVCSCELRERRRYRPDGVLFEVRWQLPGGMDWVDPLLLLRFDPPAQLCSVCGGHGVVFPDLDCPRCGCLGILRDETRAIPLYRL